MQSWRCESCIILLFRRQQKIRTVHGKHFTNSLLTHECKANRCAFGMKIQKLGQVQKGLHGLIESWALWFTGAKYRLSVLALGRCRRLNILSDSVSNPLQLKLNFKWDKSWTSASSSAGSCVEMSRQSNIQRIKCEISPAFVWNVQHKLHIYI